MAKCKKTLRILCHFCGLLPGRQVGPVAAPLPWSAAVVDHPVGQEGVLPRDLLNADVPLPGLRGGSAQDAVDLMPAPGRDRLGDDGLGQHPRLPIVDLEMEDARAFVHLPGVDQRQVAPVLLVLLQPLHPGLPAEGLTERHRVVEDAVVSASSF